MGNYENLKQSITEVIRTNGNQEITGAVLQSTLLTIISTVGANATFAGIANPTTNPGTPDGPVFYIASEAGTYTNFGNIVVGNEVVILNTSNGSWVKTETGIAPKEYINFIVSQLNKYIGIVASKGIYSIGENVLTKEDFDLSGYPRIQLSFRYVNQTNGCISFRDINENEIFALYLSDASATETFTVNIPENFDHAVVAYGAIEVTQPIVNVVLTNSALFNLHDALFTDFVKANNEVQTSVIPYNNNGWLNSGGSVINEGRGWNTDFIPVVLGDSFKYTGETQYGSPCIYVMYDINKMVIEYNNTQGIYTDKIVEITNNRVRYIRFSSYNSILFVQRINEKTSVEDKISELEQGKTDIGEIQEILTTDDLLSGYINNVGGIADDGGYHTDYIDIDNYRRLIIGASSQFATYLGAIYNSSNNFIASIEQYLGIEHSESEKTISETIRISDLKDKYPSAKYIRLGVYPTATPFRCAYYKDDYIDTYITETLPEQIKSLVGVGNILYGKKYVSCGDSFTAGDFTGYVDKDGKTGTDSDAYDKLTGKWKVYPWWITQRNSMQYLNLAVSGSYMHSGSMGFCDSRYLQIPEDADYITFMFGLNEISVDVGTSASTDKTTLWGSWNFVLEWVLTNRPSAKVGIIIADAWIDQAMHDNLIAIAKYWGVPYLDLKGDSHIPLQIGGRLNNIQVGQTAINLRNSQYQVSSTNSHPNPESHKNRSSIVENFLRTL